MTVTNRPGFTLVELIAALSVLCVAAGVTTLALAALRPSAQSADIRALSAARDSAVASGRPVVHLVSGVAVRFLPDGSSSGAVATTDGVTLVVDRLTGIARVAR